jgi:hypothetical protein
MVYPGTLFIGDNRAFLCIPMKIGVKFEHWRETGPRGRTPARAELQPARDGNRRFWWLSALRAHTKAPYKMDFHRKTLRNAKGT